MVGDQEVNFKRITVFDFWMRQLRLYVMDSQLSKIQNSYIVPWISNQILTLNL